MYRAKKTDLEIVPHMYDKARVYKIKHENYLGLSLFFTVLFLSYVPLVLQYKDLFTHILASNTYKHSQEHEIQRETPPNHMQ